jgi:hypothetical protein
VEPDRIISGVREPGISSTFLDNRYDVIDTRVGDAGFAGLFVVKCRDRNTPGSLTGDTPLASALDEGFQAVAATLRHELNILYRGERSILNQRDVGEPLCSGAGDDGLLRPPVDWILVCEFVRYKEEAGIGI